jgi:hypothetical protein
MQNPYETPASVEARAILRLVTLGSTTLEDARELIGVPERQANALSAFVALGGKAGQVVGCALVFRRKVLVEFEKLVATAGIETTSATVH